MSVHRQFGTGQQIAFDYLRLAQLYQLSRGSPSRLRETILGVPANRTALLQEATKLFGTADAQFHVLLERANDSASNDRPNFARLSAEDALSICRKLRYPRGIAEALKILGSVLTSSHADAKIRQAADYYVAALVMYPYDGHRQVIDTYDDLDTVLRHSTNQLWSQWVRGLADRIDGREGPFALIDSIAPDRAQHVTEILRRIHRRVAGNLSAFHPSAPGAGAPPICSGSPAHCPLCGVRQLLNLAELESVGTIRPFSRML